VSKEEGLQLRLPSGPLEFPFLFKSLKRSLIRGPRRFDLKKKQEFYQNKEKKNILPVKKLLPISFSLPTQSIFFLGNKLSQSVKMVLSNNNKILTMCNE